MPDHYQAKVRFCSWTSIGIYITCIALAFFLIEPLITPKKFDRVKVGETISFLIYVAPLVIGWLLGFALNRARQTVGRADGAVNPVIKWQKHSVDLQARLIPRFLWATASIDVYLEDQCILRTGGSLKLTGSRSATFTRSDSVHTVELTWGASGLSLSFPYRLLIDGTLVSASRIGVSNWLFLFIPPALGVIALGMIYDFFIRHL